MPTIAMIMLYPSSVFIERVIGINIQTMVHHGLIAVIGLALLLTKNAYQN